MRLRSEGSGDRTLAVGCSNGTVYVYGDYDRNIRWRTQNDVPHYKLDPKGKSHPTGEVLWGHNSWLYASTESDVEGAHRAIDIQKRGDQGMYNLCDRTGVPVIDSGDTMALTADRLFF